MPTARSGSTSFLRSFELGYTSTGTSTDSRTGALAFYEKAGMTVRERYTSHARDLVVATASTAR